MNTALESEKKPTKQAVKAALRDGTIEEWLLEISAEPPWTLKLNHPAGAREFVADDLFAALAALRLELEQEGVQLLCAGSRIDVFPSAMSREMSAGRKAYVTRMGERASRADLVDIFDEAPLELVGRVDDQQAFHTKWFESLERTHG
jgi:hypothetical protein